MKEKLKKILNKESLSILLVLVLIVGFALFLPNKKGNKLIAKFGEYRVYDSDIQERMNNLFDEKNRATKVQDLPPELLNSIIIEAVVNKQIMKEARRKGYYEKPELKKEFQNLKNELIKERYLNDIVFAEVFFVLDNSAEKTEKINIIIEKDKAKLKN
ncbi:MAG: hypothetical protein Ta2D_01680 [Rickettsiales bacterium]|nr:MAG: hypothetical protein Ta2D_01680 [Rickettsiales bacterium]